MGYNINIDKERRTQKGVGYSEDIMNKNFGKATFNGIEYVLQQDAYVDNYGTDGEIRYYAAAKDAQGNEYMVTWGTSEDWNNASEEWKNICKEYEPKSAPEYECPAILQDESNACDWDNPINVELI
jgi:RecJ-like exonuclease